MRFLQDHDKTVITFGEKKIRYKDLIAATASISKTIGIMPVDNGIGARVAIFSENRPEWIYVLYGVWRSGGVCVTVDFMSTSDEVSYILNDCNVSVIFCSEKTKAVLDTVLSGMKNPPRVINFDAIDIDLTGNEAYPEFQENTVAVIIYTSGTTGSPKGVMLSFGNLFAILDILADGRLGNEHVVYKKDETYIAILPFHHIYPLMGCIIAPVYCGAIISMIRELTADEIFNVCQKQGVTRVVGVPRLFALFHKGIMNEINKSALARLLLKLTKAVNRRAFSKIVFSAVQKKFGGKVISFFSGGSKLDENITGDFEAMGFAVMEAYGMTETSPLMSTCSEKNCIKGTVGYPLPGADLKLKDGEVCFKGANVMKGYYNRPEETAAMFDDEGYLHTGDRAEITPEGYVRITGRIKEIIVLPNGKNVNPEEMENEILGMFPVIKDIGIIDLEGKLFAVVFPDFQKIREHSIINIRETIKWEIIDRYNMKASHYKKIMDFAVVDKELPRTRIGKLKRFALRDLITENVSVKQSVTEPDFEEYGILKEAIEDMLGRPVNAGDHLELDLNMDSLDRVELQVRVETQFGFTLTNEDLSHYPRVTDLAGFIKKCRTKSESEKTDWGTILRQKLNFTIPRRTYMLRILLFLLRPLFKFYFRIKPKGVSNIPKDATVIFAPNHQSLLDGVVLMAILKRRMRKKTYVFAKDKNFKSRFRQSFARRANIILININRNLKETLQQMATIVKEGNNIVIFPEGARSRDGSIMAFKKTFAIISKEMNIPVVPVMIDGSYKIISIGKKIPRPGKIKVKFLEAIYPESLTYDEIVEKTHTAISLELQSSLK